MTNERKAIKAALDHLRLGSKLDVSKAIEILINAVKDPAPCRCDSPEWCNTNDKCKHNEVDQWLTTK